MITRSPNLLQRSEAREPIALSRGWQAQLRQAIRDPRELLARVSLDACWLPGAEAGHALFEVRVPEAYLTRMRPGDPKDPLLRQVLPLDAEARAVPGFVDDPLAEAEHTPRRGLIHKYPGRVLLITSPACAINCRYCFRRHFPYAENSPSREQWQASLDYLRDDPSIQEAILSGGDPLASSDKRLAWLVERLGDIGHLKRLRIHTRLPVVIPDRVDDALLAWLTTTRLQTVMVLHINHPREIDAAVIEACARLKTAGVTLLNQSVLLRGVNDDVETLAELSEALFDAGMLPYYLHVLDPVSGAAHFDVPDADAVALHRQLRDRVAGFLLPRLVREVPGERSKTPL
ncbi:MULTISPECIES: EF-P beta-lysylation protein EpmB [unclassified Modicisalibacter]|uniref:EF-P beta-lysylation protein EpmB n=1 Tax=unclassified Modicisalibacter TaxID=2679913 RepID=UPI001CCE65A5|nr:MULTISPECIES: EF-P beta-lysylation protein EpmB [unclassified Modicisalibacter]MBZ9557441.1 EF-P beta-lysylation protein EpmB [Modicisalibacter sp. R2A 31.J]MBZ9573893.1 EF-P beta-lysylation protein EpmB [Modicisalibacter sp. MOD 31.J]